MTDESTWLYKDQFEKTPTEPEPDSSCQKTGIRNILFRSIAELPDQQKEVYILREIIGCTTKEVAKFLVVQPT